MSQKIQSPGLIFLLTIILCAFVFIALRGSPLPLRSALTITLGGIFLWVTEPIPMPLTALIIIAALIISGVVSLETALGGFSTGSALLIASGFMMARGVNETTLGQRLAYILIIKFKGTQRGAVLAIILTMLIISFFVPSNMVKVTLLLPVVKSIINKLPEGSKNTTTSLLLALAYGSLITGIGFLPGAATNIVASELIGEFVGKTISYIDWMQLGLPLSLSLIPVTWITLCWLFPPEENHFKGGVNQIKKELAELGDINSREKRCIAILLITVLLWFTEGLHHLHPSVPALVAVILISLPKVGISKWDNVIKINWGTVILVCINITLGRVLIESGASVLLAETLFPPILINPMLSSVLMAVVFCTAFVQIYHLFVGNTMAVVISILPIFLELSLGKNINPVLIGFATSISAVCGFVLVIQTIPNIIVYDTGLVAQKDMIKAGTLLSFIFIACVFIMAVSIWSVFGLI